MKYLLFLLGIIFSLFGIFAIYIFQKENFMDHLIPAFLFYCSGFCVCWSLWVLAGNADTAGDRNTENDKTEND